uniref:Uncharacterized protein n=1 Tax=Hyaloperonospora arabidopsidis (strain Emoy2) TaxID=559515 RepID=M4BE33_HYAAE
MSGGPKSLDMSGASISSGGRAVTRSTKRLVDPSGVHDRHTHTDTQGCAKPDLT